MPDPFAWNTLAWGPRPGSTNRLAPSPTLADAWDVNGPVLRDAWAAARDPQTWQDAATQYGQALLGGSIAPGARGITPSSGTFHRFTNGEVMNPNVGYAMFAKKLEEVENGYGRNHYTMEPDKVDPSSVVDASSPKFQRKVLAAFKQAPDLVDSYQTTPKALTADVAPERIVNSAGLWDSPELVSHIWDNVLEPNGWTVIKTPDGVISFDPAHAQRVTE